MRIHPKVYAGGENSIHVRKPQNAREQHHAAK